MGVSLGELFYWVGWMGRGEGDFLGSHAEVCVCYAESLTVMLQMNFNK